MYQLAVLTRFAAVRDFERFERDFETAHATIHSEMESHVLQCMILWPRLSQDALARTLELWGISWENAAERTKSQPPWMMYEVERDGGWCGMWHRGYAVHVAQLSIVVRMPHTVPPAEIAEFLPLAGDSSLCMPI
jgi:hypothetical protein